MTYPWLIVCSWLGTDASIDDAARAHVLLSTLAVFDFSSPSSYPIYLRPCLNVLPDVPPYIQSSFL